MAALVSSIIRESRQVRIVPNGGWSSETYVKQNKDRLKRVGWKRMKEKYDIKKTQVIVLYFGDYDPSGLRMVENLRRDLKKLGIGFEHVAITKEQITRYGLQNLTNPDPPVMAKLENDRNNDFFKAQNDGKLFQIEVDALNALRSEDFVSLLAVICPVCCFIFRMSSTSRTICVVFQATKRGRTICSTMKQHMKRRLLIYN